MTDIVDAKFSEDMDLADIFSELGEDCKIGVHRKEPEWCSGHIRTVHFDPREPVDLDWIQKKFGGEKLMIRLYGPKSKQNKSGYLAARTVDIMGPPRDGFGIEMVQGPDGKAVKITEYELACERHKQKMGVQQLEDSQPAPAQPADGLSNNALVQTLIQSQSQQHNAMLQMMGQRVQSLEEMLYRQAPGQVGAAVNPIDQIKQTAEALKHLKAMEGDFSGDGGGSGDLLGMLGPVIQNMFGNNQNAQLPQTAPQGALRAPRRRRLPKRRLPKRRLPIEQSTEQSSPEQSSPEQSTEQGETLSSIADKLAMLGPDEAAEVVLQALGDMPEKKRAAAMQAFVYSMNQPDNLDDSSNSVDTLSHETIENDPFGETAENNPIPIQREPTRPNESNSEVDRKSDPQRVDLPANT